VIFTTYVPATTGTRLTVALPVARPAPVDVTVAVLVPPVATVAITFVPPVAATDGSAPLPAGPLTRETVNEDVAPSSEILVIHLHLPFLL